MIFRIFLVTWGLLLAEVILLQSACGQQMLPFSSDTYQQVEFQDTNFYMDFPVSFGASFYDGSITRGNCNDLSRLAIEPFRGRTVFHAIGEWNSFSPDQGTGLSAGFNTNIWSGGIGRDYQLGKRVIAGLSVDLSQLHIKPNDPAYQCDITSFSGLLYMSLFGSLWYCDLSIGAGRNGTRSQMTAPAGNFENKYTSTQWNYEVDLGLRIRRGYTWIEPMFGLHVSRLDEPGTANLYPSEGQIILPLSSSLGSWRTMLGSRFAWEYAGNLATIRPMMIIAWIHEFGDPALFVTGETLPFPVVWRLGENEMSRDRLHLGAGVTFALRDSVDLFAHYNSTIAANYAGYTLFGGFNIKF